MRCLLLGTMALLVPFLAAESQASYFVQSTTQVIDGSNRDEKCSGAATSCDHYEGMATALSSSSSGMYGGGATAYADLSTGRVGVSSNFGTSYGEPCYSFGCTAYSYGGSAAADWEDVLTFDPASFGGSDRLTVGVKVTVHGTWDVSHGSPQMWFYAFSASDLTAHVRYDFLGSTTDPGSFGPYGIFARDGAWSQFGPDEFIGRIDVSASNPFLQLELGLSCVDACKFSHTGSIELDLPTGATYHSDSGVFLSKAAVIGVPEPSAVALLVVPSLGFGAVLYSRRRARRASAQ